MSMKIEGLGEFARRLRDLGRRIQELPGDHEVTLEELFPDSFIRQHTDYGSIDELIEASGPEIDFREDCGSMRPAERDAFIDEHTSFANWEEMMNAAVIEYVWRKIGVK